MKTVHYAEFKREMKKYFDAVESNNEILAIKSESGRGTVLMSLEEYNSIIETAYLLSSKANADRLYESIKQLG